MDEKDRPNQPHREDIELHAETERALKILNCGGPSLAEVYLSVVGEQPLNSEQQAHVASCRVCQRAIGLARREVEGVRAEESPLRLEEQPARRRLRIPHFLVPTGLAAAIIIAIGLIWHAVPTAMADVYADAANAGNAMFYFAANFASLFSEDPDMAEQYGKIIEDATRKRDDSLAVVRSAPDLSRAPWTDVFQSWQAIYQSLRELGDLTGAIRENRAALAYVADNPSGQRLTGWECVLLDGLGNTYAMFGDYAAAHRAYVDSIALRRQRPGQASDPHADEPGYEGHLAGELVIPYLRLVMLSIGQEDLQEAGQWQAQAEKTLRDCLHTICELNGNKPNSIKLSVHATIWEAWNALPDEFHHPKAAYSNEEVKAWPPAWQVFGPDGAWLHFVGAVLYHQAVLQRLRGDYAAARQALDRAATLEDWLTQNPGNDEYRLPFILRLERARLAIVTGHHDRALKHLDEAEEYVATVKKHLTGVEAGEVASQPIPDVNKLPISPARRAEVQLLRGIALLGLDPYSKEGARLIRKALAVPEKLATGLPAEQRQAFIQRFAPWQLLATQAGSSDSTPQQETGGRP